VVKLSPVIHAFSAYPMVDVIVHSTGQHTDLLMPCLRFFGIEPARRLCHLPPGRTLDELFGTLVTALGETIASERPDWIIVQGDTTSALAAAIAARHNGSRLGHVEAGLRTGNLDAPFPEEMNRRLIAQAADLHFAPTERARENLLKENLPGDRIHITGNTVIDALLYAQRRMSEVRQEMPDNQKRRILVTLHRRENAGPRAESIGSALRTLVAQRADVEMLFVAHPNPVFASVMSHLVEHPRIRVSPPLDYPEFVHALVSSHLVMTDSGGLQEEAVALGIPTLVLREATERQEGIDAGGARLVGCCPERIISHAARLLDDPKFYGSMAVARNCYGDGRAGGRIAKAIVGSA